MHPKLKIFQAKEEKFDAEAKLAKASHPLKTLKNLPKMPGIANETRKNLRRKSFWYLIKHDHNKVFYRYFFKKPFKHIFGLIKAYFKKKPYIRDNDFFLFNIKDIADFKKTIKAKNTIFLLGFSYCHKPLECPSGRFTDECIHDFNNPVCKQCFIGKCAYLTKKTKAKLLFIPTIHYIGEKIFEYVTKYPDQKITFLITACELSLEMFKDFGNMLNLSGIGVRLDGRICNTMRAFELSEKGIKPNLTVVLDETQQKMLHIIKSLHEKD
jgi:hypothetical protein